VLFLFLDIVLVRFLLILSKDELFQVDIFNLLAVLLGHVRTH